MPSSISSRGGGSPAAREAQAASAFASKASKGVSTVVANATAAAEASVAGAATAGAFPRGGHWEVSVSPLFFKRWMCLDPYLSLRMLSNAFWE